MGTVGTTRGMRRIASLIWFFHKLTKESLWFSVSGFFAGVELLNSDARLSLTGLYQKWFNENRREFSLRCDSRWINYGVETLNSLITEWPGLRDYSRALLDDTMLFHESEQTSRPGVELHSIVRWNLTLPESGGLQRLFHVSDAPYAAVTVNYPLQVDHVGVQYCSSLTLWKHVDNRVENLWKLDFKRILKLNFTHFVFL